MMIIITTITIYNFNVYFSQTMLLITTVIKRMSNEETKY